MPSLIDKRLHADLETKQHETLLRVEGVADKAAAIALRAGRDALQLIMDGSVVHHNQREAADVLKGIFPAVSALLDKLFRRLHYWSYGETVRILAKQIPRRWFRKAVPAVVTVGEAALAGVPISGTNIFVDTETEPVAGKRLSDADWADFLKQHLFLPPSREQVERAIYAPVAGLHWRQRLDILSHKITDMDRLAGILATGASSGMSQAELKRQIQPVVQNISSSAARIARTEGLRIVTSAQREQYAELGDMLAGVQIVATLDENTRPAHAARNGRIYWVDRRKKPTIDELPLLPDEPNCRCYDSPVLHPPEEFENDPQLRAEFQNAAGNAIPDPQVYGQWFDRADPGRRKMAVGVQRYNAVAKKLGRTPQFTDFIGTDGSLLSLKHLHGESPEDRQSRLQAVQAQMKERQRLLQKSSRFGFVPSDPVKSTFAGQGRNILKSQGALETDTAPQYETERQAVRAMFGQGYLPTDVIALSGAVDDGDAFISVGYAGALTVKIWGDGDSYFMKRTFRKKGDGSIVCENDLFEVSGPRKGTGTRMFSEQVERLVKAGVKRIETLAARHSSIRSRDNKYVGYKIWPKLGYDGPLLDTHRDSLPGEFQNTSTIQELYATKEGTEAWEKFGTNISLTFDLTEGSRSRKILEMYLKKRSLPETSQEQQLSEELPVSRTTDNPLSEDDAKILEEVWKEIWDNPGQISLDI